MEIVITVADKEAARILHAFATGPVDNRRDATIEEVAAFLLNQLRGAVANTEAAESATTKRQEVALEVWETKVETKDSQLPNIRR